MLGDVFKHKFKSFAKAKVIRKKNNKKKGRGFGFVSFLDPNDMVAALKTMNGKYCGTRPMKLRKSDWDKRSISTKKARKMRNKNELKLYDAL
jgi:RNA recognition motif-containing protein